MSGVGDRERERRKRSAAEAALGHVQEHNLVGLGTGSTVEHLIDALAEAGGGHLLKAFVASSRRTARQLRERGIAVVPFDDVDEIPVYVDGCDEADPRLRLLKGGGGSHTGEKKVALRSELFVCIADDSKLVEALGAFPVAVEVVEPLRMLAEERLRAMGGAPVLRRGFVTDAGNPIIDVEGLDVASDPLALELEIDALPGVVECGIFAARPADLLLLGTASGVREIRPASRPGS